MVLNNHQLPHHHLIALSGLQINLNTKMTPKIHEAASSYMTPTINNNNNQQQQQTSNKKRGKQFHPVRLFTNGGSGSPKLFNGASTSPLNGSYHYHQQQQPQQQQAIRSPEIVHQQLKRYSPKSSYQTSNHTKIDNHNNPRFSPPQQQHQQQQQQRTSPSRISPTVKSGSGTPVAYAGAKFSEPPPPNELPKPPSEWIVGQAATAIFKAAASAAPIVEQQHNSAFFDANGSKNLTPLMLGNKCCNEISDQLKIMLNIIQA